MKYKLSSTERAQRIEQRAQARTNRTGRAAAFRDWFEERRTESMKRNAAAAKAYRERPRGVDRVPDRYRVHAPVPKYVVQHTSANYTQRRAWALGQGRSLPSSGNESHVNLGRDRKPGARLRVELRPNPTEDLHTDTYTCRYCSAAFGITGIHTGSDDDYAADEYYREQVDYHEAGECSPGRVRAAAGMGGA